MSDESHGPERTPESGIHLKSAGTGEQCGSSHVDFGVFRTSVPVCAWGGMVIAGMGFFLTPLLTAIPASLCALKLRHDTRRAAGAILGLLLASGIFWGAFLLRNVSGEFGFWPLLSYAHLLVFVLWVPAVLLLIGWSVVLLAREKSA